jgi:hypothetical protein
MSHRPSNGVNGCTVQSKSFYPHAGFARYWRTTAYIARQPAQTRQSNAMAGDIIDSPLKPATFTLEPYRCIGQVCMTGAANFRVTDHTTLSPSIRVARTRAAPDRVAAAKGLGFAQFVQQLVTQNVR